MRHDHQGRTVKGGPGACRPSDANSLDAIDRFLLVRPNAPLSPAIGVLAGPGRRPDTIKSMNIYFAASIRGGRRDEDIYRRLIDELRHHGAVQTEQVALPEDEERGMTDREIHGRDMAWLEDADVMVAEVTTPSLGVGYELANAERLGLEILCLFRPSSGRRLSAMVAGSPRMRVVPYETIADAKDAIAAFLTRLDGGK